MDSSAREAMEKHLADSLNNLLNSLLRSEEVSPEFYERIMRSQKSIENDFEVISQKFGKIFLRNLEKYRADNGVKFKDIPHGERRIIQMNSINEAINEWEKERNVKEKTGT